jgi:hypothetical protein
MHMQMVDGLTAIAATVQDGSESVGQPQLNSQIFRHQQ